MFYDTESVRYFEVKTNENALNLSMIVRANTISLGKKLWIKFEGVLTSACQGPAIFPWKPLGKDEWRLDIYEIDSLDLDGRPEGLIPHAHLRNLTQLS